MIQRKCPYCRKLLDYVGEISQKHEGFLIHVYLCRDVIDCGCRMELSRSPNKDLLTPPELETETKIPTEEEAESQSEDVGFSSFLSS